MPFSVFMTGDVESRALGESVQSRPRPRIQSLSDLIFGLALSIGAIALIGSPPASVAGLYNDLLSFAFNFLILITVWMRYTRVMSALPVETRRTSTLNTLLLFAVSLEPFLFNTFRSGNTTSPLGAALFSAATAIYGLDLGVIMVVMGVFTVSLADEEKKLVPADMLKELRGEAIVWFASGACFLGSAAPVFDNLFVLGTWARSDLWLGALVISLVRRGSKRLRMHAPEKGASPPSS